jgi:hypothetical protein
MVLVLMVDRVSLLESPQWNDSIFATPIMIEQAQPSNEITTVTKLHSDFIDFFSSLAPPEERLLNLYPVIGRVMSLVGRPFPEGSSEALSNEEPRLMSLFYVAVMLKNSQRSHADLQWLNDFLAMTEQVWTNSVEMLRWLLKQITGHGREGPRSVQDMELLNKIGAALKWSPWRRMEDRLLNILMGGAEGAMHDALWNGDVFSG